MKLWIKIFNVSIQQPSASKLRSHYAKVTCIISMKLTNIKAAHTVTFMELAILIFISTLTDIMQNFMKNSLTVTIAQGGLHVL